MARPVRLGEPSATAVAARAIVRLGIPALVGVAGWTPYGEWPKAAETAPSATATAAAA